MGYGLMKLPPWVVGVCSGAFWGLAMLLLPPARVSSGSVAGVVVGGALFGTIMALTTRRQRRKSFTVEGRTLSGRERVAVVRAVHLGEPLPDGELRVAARRYAERLSAQDQRWWPMAIAVLLAVGLNAWLAVFSSPWWWLGVVLWPTAVGLVLWQARRQRTAVDRYLATTPAG